MQELLIVAPAFAEVASDMVYCTRTTTDRRGRPRARIVHQRNNPYVSCNFWDGAERYDTCVAECRAELLLDEQSKVEGWERFKAVPPPLGYDPGIIPQSKAGPASPQWGVMRLTSGAEGEILTWQAD